MSNVLIIDDDLGSGVGFGGLLRSAGHSVLTASSGHEGLALFNRTAVDVVIADLRLPDMSGIDILADLRQAGSPVPIIMVTGFGSVEVAVQAMRLGATNFLEKPLIGDELVQCVEEALGRGAEYSRLRQDTNTQRTASISHAGARWASAVVAVLSSPVDLRTLPAWAEHIAISTGGLRNWCRSAGLPARRSLLFARLLRAVRGQEAGHRRHDSLDCADKRTLDRLVAYCWPLSARSIALPANVEEFLDNQRLIHDRQALSEVRVKLSQMTSRIT